MPTVSALLLSLVSLAGPGTPAEHIYGLEDFPSYLNLPRLQVAFVFYDKANLNEFRERARAARSLEDWESGNPHFVVSGYGIGRRTVSNRSLSEGLRMGGWAGGAVHQACL